MPVRADDLQLTAPAPDPVIGISAQIVGPIGSSIYHYWWVAHYPIGVAIVSAPVLVRNAPDITSLSATNYVTVSGQPALGATTYDLLRTNSPRLPTVGPANIAVATALTSPTFNDQGAALTAYNIAGLAAGAPVTAHITVNNRDFSQPTMVMSPFGTAVQSLVFPDGSTQSTAGISAGQIYSWTQDVNANLHKLLQLGQLELLGGGFGFNFQVTPTAGTFPVGTLLVQNESSGLFPVAVNQSGDVWIGGVPVSGRAARLSIITPTSTVNPSIYCYNVVSPQGANVVLESATATSKLTIKNTNASYSYNVASSSGGFLSIIDDNASPNGYRIIIQAGKIGIANGTLFTPAHLLELNADDAGKPTTNTWTITSDIRTKRDVRALEGGMSVIDALEPIVAEYNGLASTPEGSRVVSFDPDKLAPILPSAVKIHRAKLHPDDTEESDIKGVNNHEVIFHLILAVQQLSSQLKELEASLAVGA